MSNHNPPTNGFKKGDPRINRKGRPKDFNALRELGKEIAHEKASTGGETIIINGHAATISEVILRQWAMSKDFVKQKAFLEITYGKVPDEVRLSGELNVLEVKAFDYSASIAALAPGPMADSEPSSEDQSDRHGPAVG